MNSVYKTVLGLLLFYGVILQNFGSSFDFRIAHDRPRHKRSPESELCKGDTENLYHSETEGASSYPVDYERHVVDKSKKKGAVCIDGTPAVYYLRKTTYPTTGRGKWMIVLPGGAWCSSKETCFWRSQTNLGSAKYAPAHMASLGGILSSNSLDNPHFYDWNVLYLQYCDGSSFLGNSDKPVLYKNTRLYSRGRRILSAFLDNIVVKYFNNATLKKVLVVGYSAGGLAVITNAHYISVRLSTQNTSVYFVSDAGFFVDISCTDNSRVFQRWMHNVYTYHHVGGQLNPKCVQSQHETEWKCLIPAVLLHFTTSNLTIVNSLHDGWQLIYLKGTLSGYTPHSLSNHDLAKASQLRMSIFNAIQPLLPKPNLNFFLFSCMKHCSIIYNKPWTGLQVSKIKLQDFIYEYVNGIRHRYVDTDIKHILC